MAPIGIDQNEQVTKLLTGDPNAAMELAKKAEQDP
jgi:hypothetical protein